MPEGRESPPPERQTDAQLNNPSQDFGTSKVGNKGEEIRSELKVIVPIPMYIYIVGADTIEEPRV